ncbi:NUDIX domain-containing protein [Litoreibacter ascidiaceicola]|uniref:NUDIX domain-containing protein n=1 Tax=Litoreibacter ascidiaceicola TaxID=1486859 RepID=A0A1M5B440_9RHOB|nr:CoA pyrophosphatase [Litoreibacter ascidiaceicola]SHF37176.1 NUDIX domain-containing protein [Litoreibacter ascidiaceicola]
MTGSDLIKTVEAALSNPGAATSDFDLNPNVVLPETRVLRDAAVLVALMPTDDGARLILTKRSSALKHHPGQIAFPGGKRDGDETLATAALREAEEEIGLDRKQVRLIGTLSPHETVTSFQVTPHVGVIDGPFDPVAELGEVAEIFTVPLVHVLNPDNYAIEGRRWRGQRRLYFVVPYGPYYIWGATARMLRSLADQVRL